MNEIKVGLIGVGNCASSLIQGIHYYSKSTESNKGLMHSLVGKYRISDIKICLAIDIDKRKVGKDLSEAIFAEPNCTKAFCESIPFYGIPVIQGLALDGVSPHTQMYDEANRIVACDNGEPDKESIINAIKDSDISMLVNYLPVGSSVAAEFYANCALEANVAFINCMPYFIASDTDWIRKFEEKGLPCIGDDIKSQLGATIVHRELIKLFEDRGIDITNTYQLNTGGNTDFLNMLNRSRLIEKKISKTSSVQSNLNQSLPEMNIHVGPSDYVPWQKDNKICFIRIEGTQFGGVPMNLELRLSVEDSPNSAGIIVDAIRCMQIAIDRKMSGHIFEPSTYFMKHPYLQKEDFLAKKELEGFIYGKSNQYK